MTGLRPLDGVVTVGTDHHRFDRLMDWLERWNTANPGAVRWTARGGGRISGGPSIVGRVVYFADLDSKSTYGVGTATGRHLFKLRRGRYNPVVSDGRRIYVTGFGSITKLTPRRRR